MSTNGIAIQRKPLNPKARTCVSNVRFTETEWRAVVFVAGAMNMAPATWIARIAGVTAEEFAKEVNTGFVRAAERRLRSGGVR
jgi:hypothetical protein